MGHPVLIIFIDQLTDLQRSAAVPGTGRGLRADAPRADLVLVVEESGHLEALPVRHHRHRRRLQHVRVRRVLVATDATPAGKKGMLSKLTDV